MKSVTAIPDTVTVKLEKLRVGAQVALSQELLGEDVKIIQNVLNERIIFSVKGYVWAESEKVRRQTIKFPRDWWQAFKERWFPNWLLNRYPVDYHIVDIDVNAIYPGFRFAIPNQEGRLIINRTDDFSSEYE